MGQPSEVVRGFYEFCRECICQLRERPKLARALGEVFTFEQAFWIQVVRVALCMWDDDAEYEIRLSEVFRVYLTIYREEIDKNMTTEDEQLFVKMQKDVYDAANKIMYGTEDPRRVGLRLARLALREETNVVRLTLAASDITSFAPAISPLPYKLVEDI